MKSIIKKSLLLSFIPIIAIHLVFLPLWIISTKYKEIMFRTYLTSIESLIDIIFVPLYLLITNFVLNIVKKQRVFILNIIIMLIASFLSNMLHYFNWGISVNMLFNPDFETILLFKYFIIVSSVVILLFSIIFQFVLLIVLREKNLTTAST